MNEKTRNRVWKWSLIGLSGVAALAMALGGCWLYRHETQAIRSQKQSELKAIAELKATQITAWRNERLGDARVQCSSALLRSAAGRWSTASGDAALRTEVAENMELVRTLYGYENVIVAGSDGEILFSLNPRLTVLDANSRQLVAQAISSRGAVFGDFFRCSTCNKVHLDVAAAILDLDNRPVAALILRTDAEQFLYPLVQSWPTPSRSAETLLVRRDGDDVLFLNKLRHRPDPALTLRIPLSRSDISCVRAVLGQSGAFEGRDNRGVKVLAEILPVPGSPWFMVAKVDADEILAEARYRGQFIFFFTALCMLLTGVMAAFVFSFRQKALYRNLYRAEHRRRQIEEKLKDAKALLESAISSITDTFYVFDLSGKLLLWNDTLARVTGYSDQELSAKGALDFFSGEDVRQISEAIEKIWKDGSAQQEANFVLKDGTQIPYEFTGSILRDGAGNTIGFSGTGRDLTERKRAEERSKLDEARANALLELSQMTDRSAADIANHAMESAIRLTGSTIGYIAFANEDETVLTMHYWSKIAMQECAVIGKPIVYPLKDTGLWGEAIRQRKAVITNDYAAPNPLKKGTPPGHVAIARHMNVPVFDGGKIVAVAGVGNKVEDYRDDDVKQLTLFMDGMWRILCRKRAEAAMQQFNQQLETTAVQVKQLMNNVIQKQAFTDRFVNPTLPPCWETKNCDNAACPAYHNDKNLRCWEVAGTLCCGMVQGKFAKKLNDCRLCEVYQTARANPVMDLGETFNTMLGILNDRQEQLKNTNQQLEAAIEQAQQLAKQAECANRAKSAFLANMSHEIRTPMTSILGYADLLMDDALDAADRKTFLTTVRRNGEHLLQLINDILDLSKIESGKMVMDLQPCHIPSTVADVASMMRPRAEQQKSTLEVRYIGPLPKTICTDAARLRQVIVNLMGNAVKFTEQGNIRISVSFLPQWRPGQPAVSVEVTDTGIGIRQEALSRLFEPFTQADATITGKYGGTGLGLAISRQIVAALGGDLTVQSVFGVGSTFTVTIPSGDVSGVEMLESPGEAISDDEPRARWAPSLSVLQGVKLLLVEDSPDNQILLCAVLGNVGAEIEVVENGRLAVQRALAAAFDVVLMDMNMPKMDGYEATRKLRDCGYSRPILALTANAMSGDAQRCLAAGCNAHLGKPIDRKRLIETVAQYAMLKTCTTDAQPAGQDQAMTPGQSDGIRSRFADDTQLADILPRFVERLPSQVDALCEALEQENLEDVERIAHRIKGAGGSYGYPTLSAVAKSLELAAKAGDVGKATAVLTGIKEVCAAIQAGWTGQTAEADKL